MCDAYEAKDANLEYPITCVFSYKEVRPKSGDSLFNLDVKPAKILPVEKHQWYELLVDFLRESFYWKSSDVSFHEAKELIQYFAFDSHYITADNVSRLLSTYSLSIFFWPGIELTNWPILNLIFSRSLGISSYWGLVFYWVSNFCIFQLYDFEI